MAKAATSALFEIVAKNETKLSAVGKCSENQTPGVVASFDHSGETLYAVQGFCTNKKTKITLNAVMKCDAATHQLSALVLTWGKNNGNDGKSSIGGPLSQ